MVAQAAVRVVAVVFLPIDFDDDAGFPPRREPLSVEAFVAKLAVETLEQVVLPRLSRRVVDLT